MSNSSVATAVNSSSDETLCSEQGEDDKMSDEEGMSSDPGTVDDELLWKASSSQVAVGKCSDCLESPCAAPQLRLCGKCWLKRREEQKRPKSDRRNKGKEKMKNSESNSKNSESNSKEEKNLCSFCVVREKDAGFVHGSVVHRICCYRCAKRLFKRRQRCPVCRQKIEKIAKIAFA